MFAPQSTSDSWSSRIHTPTLDIFCVKNCQEATFTVSQAEGSRSQMSLKWLNSGEDFGRDVIAAIDMNLQIRMTAARPERQRTAMKMSRRTQYLAQTCVQQIIIELVLDHHRPN
jgi:hypothetical protein